MAGAYAARLAAVLFTARVLLAAGRAEPLPAALTAAALCGLAGLLGGACAGAVCGSLATELAARRVAREAAEWERTLAGRPDGTG